MPETPLQSVSERGTVEVTYAPPRRSWRRRLSSTVGSWARSTFSRDSYVTSLKSLLWVLPLTVLIWVYAEREQVVATDVVIRVKTPAEDSGRVIHFVPATDNIVHAGIRGPQVDIEEVKDYIENNTISIDVDRSLTRGEHPIDVTAQLNKLPEVATKGVTVERATVLRVSIDPVIEKEVEVKASPDFVGTPPVFTPVQVRLRGPESQVDRPSKNGQLVAYANINKFTAQLAEGGSQTLKNVPLSPPPELDATEVTFSPVVVTAQVEVPKSQESAVLPYVTVFAAYPTQIAKADQYRANVPDNLLRGVRVTGPADEINKLKTGATPAFAYFRVDLDNPDTNTPRTAPVDYGLPPGVRASDEDKKRTVSYILEPRPRTNP
jgi:hypothetical protein